jgi:oxygen-independent coproporphyrinogen-3 oxidase
LPAAGIRPRAETGEFPPRPPVALYVHVPFCLSVCPYCDFVVYAGSTARGPRNRVAAYLDALQEEIRLRAEGTRRMFGYDRPVLESVYFGGGTPSLLSGGQVAVLLDAIARGFGLSGSAEITLEANPGAADRGDLGAFRAAGVTRLSIGARSLQPEELRALGRRHSAGDARAAVRSARGAGFENVSVDLLYDIPAQTLESWTDTLDQLLELEVDHVSAYALTLEDGRFDGDGRLDRDGDRLPARPGALRWRARARAGQDDDRAADLYALADQRLGACGLAWYEISNWARPGRESRHNLSYWTGAAYEGVGPGAHAFDGGLSRRWNAAFLEEYIDALTPRTGQPRLPPGGSETLHPDVARAERAILALRLSRGLDRDWATRRSVRPALEWARTNGLLEDGGAGVRLSLRGRLLGNSLFERLL